MSSQNWICVILQIKYLGRDGTLLLTTVHWLNWFFKWRSNSKANTEQNLTKSYNYERRYFFTQKTVYCWLVCLKSFAVFPQKFCCDMSPTALKLRIDFVPIQCGTNVLIDGLKKTKVPSLFVKERLRISFLSSQCCRIH